MLLMASSSRKFGQLYFYTVYDILCDPLCSYCRSYYSAEGCAGPVAQYDLVSADEYVSYDDAIGACGMFQCHSEGMNTCSYTCKHRMLIVIVRFHCVNRYSGDGGADPLWHLRWQSIYPPVLQKRYVHVRRQR